MSSPGDHHAPSLQNTNTHRRGKKKAPNDSVPGFKCCRSCQQRQLSYRSQSDRCTGIHYRNLCLVYHIFIPAMLLGNKCVYFLSNGDIYKENETQFEHKTLFNAKQRALLLNWLIWTKKI